jgi:hypothetical protein
MSSWNIEDVPCSQDGEEVPEVNLDAIESDKPFEGN